MTRSQLERGVERRLRRKVFVSGERAALRFRVVFERRGTELEARIEVTSNDGSPRGTRSLVTSNHCSALDDSLALSVALLVDQPPEPEPASALLPLPAESSAPPTSPAGPPAPRGGTSTIISIPPEVAATREPWRASVGAAVSAVWGPLPGFSPVLVGWLRLVPRHFVPLIIQAEVFAQRRAARDETSGADFRAWRVGLSLCPVLWEQADRSLGACVGQRVGWLRVTGYGFDHDSREGRLTYAVTLGVDAAQRLLGPLSLRAYLGAEAPVVRDRFDSSGGNATELFRPASVGLAASIGLEVAAW